MRYKNCRCVSCNNIFTENDDVVVCPVCGSPHHRECWQEHAQCANAEKHGDNFEWIYPEELREKKEEKKPEAKTAIYKFRNGETAVICPHCKSLNYGNDALCMKCRKPLQGEARENPNNPPEMNSRSSANESANGAFSGNDPRINQGEPRFDGPQDDYYFYQKFGGLRPDTLVSGIPAAELTDYIGESQSGKYIRRFATMDRFGKKASFSICAFLLGPLWYLYRKMYKEGLIFIALSLVIAAVSGICAVTQPVKDMYAEMGELYSLVLNREMTLAEFEEALSEIEEEYRNVVPPEQDTLKITLSYIMSIFSIALTVGMSVFANYFYLKKIKKDIFAIREECNDMPSYRRTLRERGGVSVGGAVVGVMAHILIYIVQLIPAYMVLFNSMK